MSDIDLIVNELNEAKELLIKVLDHSDLLKKIELAADHMVTCIKNGGKMISCGNGGSLCDAMHFAEELSGRFRKDRKALPALAIADPSHMSCTANDYGFDHVFSRFVEAIGRENDLLLAISTSGNSKNILEACKAARSRGMKIIALTGNNGGQLGQEADININIPHQGFSDRIQEMHIKIIHILIRLIEEKIA